jgi:glutathione gamma-glutamylcysteinyltransferase
MFKKLHLSNKFYYLKNSNFTQTMTNTQMMEKLKNVSVYKRIMPNLGIHFSSSKSKNLLKESIIQGNANSFFQLSDQFQTQGDPSFCGPSSMICVFNSLNVDPKKKWKGIWRWYLEEVIKCLDINKTKDYGMTIEEFAIIAKCNGVFTEIFRPDLNEELTEQNILNSLKNKSDESKFIEINTKLNHLDYIKVVTHDHSNSECKNQSNLTAKKGNEDFFRACVYSSTRRENFFLVANTSRKALKQTGDGHFSPIAAFHKNSDNLLLFDSARFKYNSMWFTIPMIYNAFVGLDKASDKPRGFILCSRYY